jgi:hypothetical protein
MPEIKQLFQQADSEKHFILNKLRIRLFIYNM